jgi:hypothetical protein
MYICANFKIKVRMKKRFFTLFWGVLTVFFLLPVQAKASIVRPIDTVYYYIKVDTAFVDIGYLRVDSSDTRRVLVDDVKGDYALWRFSRKAPYAPLDYYIINKVTQDTVIFNVPAADAIAVIDPAGDLDVWYDLFDERDLPDKFLSYFDTERYFLTYDNGTVKVSKETSVLTRMQFCVERQKIIPDENEFYRIKADTAGMPGVLSIGYLRPDSIKLTLDSLTVDTVRNDWSAWKFAVDTIVNDTTYFRISNKKTDKLLAFDIPVNDTIARVQTTGQLKRWGIPFFMEEKGAGKLIVRDTSAKMDYFLGLTADSVVMLVSDTTVVKCLSFLLEDEIPPVVIPLFRFDSAQVYKVKYMSGTNTGKFMGVDIRGTSVLLDSVYAHVPDGQYVVSRRNTNGLLNRTQTEAWYTGTFDFLVDSSSVAGVKDTIADMYIYRGDTVEVKPVNYGSFDKTNPVIGYKYFLPSDLRSFCYYFSYASPDTLFGRILGADATVRLLAGGDTATYLIEEARVFSGAPAVGDIVSLKKYMYRMRSMADTTLYLSGNSPSVMTNVNNAGLFSFKEADDGGGYYIVPESYTNKFIVDSVSKQLIHAPIDSSAYSYFRIEQTDRPSTDEPDPYIYLTEFPESKGKGFYEFRITDPQSLQQKWLTKNFYDYAVLGKEGESMLRAGSYTPYDLQLWVDTARGPAFNPDKPSFYIVKDVDTTVANFDKFKISGYFLHVMDSTSLASYDNYVVTVDGEIYNRVNFINAARSSANELRLGSGTMISGPAVNEYRFYLQESEESGKYYIVTEAGYGDAGRTNARGYLSVKNNVTYFGPRDGALKVSFQGSTVSNEVIPPPIAEEVNREVSIAGGTGQVVILNAAGQSAMVFNILGQQIAKRELTSDKEYIPVSRGILIVKVGAKTQKIVVK